MSDTVIASRYALVRLLGEGGMGAVYEAEHLVTRRRVALKVLHPGQQWTPAAVERFIREAQIAAAIGHPNIIDVLDAGHDEQGAPFLVFEYLLGSSVGGLIESAGRLPLDQALAVTADVLDALVAAHARGVLHRDIKPDNVFLAGDGRGRTVVKLLDFGIARATSELGLSPHERTQTGVMMGTPAYMSPEQIRGLGDIDARADVWSVGAMLYEMLSGALPFQADNLNALMFAIATEPMQPLASVAPEVPVAVAELVARSLVQDRSARTPSAAAMLEEVQRARADLGLIDTSSPRPSVPPRLSSAAPAEIGLLATMPNTPTAATGEKSTLDPQETVRPARRVPATSLLLVVVLVLVAAVAGVVALLRRQTVPAVANPVMRRSLSAPTRAAAPAPLASTAADDATELPITRVSGSAAEVSPPSDRGASVRGGSGRAHRVRRPAGSPTPARSRHSPAGTLIRPATRFDEL